jgi:hypothetical protein
VDRAPKAFEPAALFGLQAKWLLGLCSIIGIITLDSA